MAIFSVSLCQPVYAEVSWWNSIHFLQRPTLGLTGAQVMGVASNFVQSLRKVLEQMFPGLNFDGSIVQPRRMLESEVVLDIPEKTSDREIIPSRLPTAVSSDWSPTLVIV